MDILAETSDAVQIANLVCTLVGGMFAAYMAYKMAQLNTKANAAAAKVEEVKDVLHKADAQKIEKLDCIQATAAETLKLVNGDMTEQLRLHAETAKKLADTTGHQSHFEIAELAEKMYEQHRERDRLSGRTPAPSDIA